MGRVKRKMELITAQKNRESCFQTRNKSMKKKAQELSILCGVKVGMIMYRPEDSTTYSEMWPHEDGSVLDDLITDYRNQDCLHRKKRSTHFLGENKDDLVESARENRYPTWDSRLEEFSEEDLRHFAGLVDIKIQRIMKEKVARGKQVISLHQPYLLQRMPMTMDHPPFSSSSSAINLGMMETTPKQMDQHLPSCCYAYSHPPLMPMPMIDPTSMNMNMNMKMMMTSCEDNYMKMPRMMMMMPSRSNEFEIEGISCDMNQQEHDHLILQQLLQLQ